MLNVGNDEIEKEEYRLSIVEVRVRDTG